MDGALSGQGGRGTGVRWGAFAAIVAGVLLFLLAAGGGFEAGGLVVRMETGAAQVVVSALGIGLLAAGILLLGDQRRPARKFPERKRREDERTYGIRMLRPARFGRRMVVEGWFAVAPPEDALRLFTVTEDGYFQPQSIAAVNKAEQHWTAAVDLGPGPYYAVYVVAALVEGAGAVLWDYYYQTGDAAERAPIAGQIEACALVCDRFLVEGTLYE